MDVTDRLYKLDLPTCLRICAGTDGSVTHLLELMTKKHVSVETMTRLPDCSIYLWASR